MESIDAFLILYLSLSRLAIWIERIAVKVEIVGSSLTTYNIFFFFKYFHFFIINHDLLCLCARLFICALWSPAGKGLTSWLSLVVSAVSLSFSHWYPGSGVVLDCIDS